MKFTLENTNIYDNKIKNKIGKLVNDNIACFDKEKFYKLAIYYSADLEEFQNFVFEELKIKNKKEKRNKKCEALGTQLHKVSDCFINKGINIIENRIEGEPTGKETVNIKVEEIQKKNNFKVYNIHPEYTPEQRIIANERMLQKLYEIFYGN